MAVKKTHISADEQVRQRKTFYRALSENVQSVLFFWHGVALFCFALALGYWARGDLETQKKYKELLDVVNVNNVYSAQLKAEIKVLKEKIKELEK